MRKSLALGSSALLAVGLVVAAASPANAATNVDSNGWTTNGEWVEGGIELESTGWSEGFSEKNVTDYSVELLETIGFDFSSTAAPAGWGIHFLIDGTTDGTLVYEPIYTDKFWSNEPILPVSGGGQGGPFSGSLEDLIATVGETAVVTNVKFVFAAGDTGTGILRSIDYGENSESFDRETPTKADLVVSTTVDKGEPKCSKHGGGFVRTKTTVATTVYTFDWEKKDFVGVTTEVVTYGKRPATDRECPEPVHPTPVKVVDIEIEVLDKCGTDDDELVLPEVDGVTFEVLPENDRGVTRVVVRAEDGYVLVGEHGKKEFRQKAVLKFRFSDEPCEVDEPDEEPVDAGGEGSTPGGDNGGTPAAPAGSPSQSPQVGLALTGLDGASTLGFAAVLLLMAGVGLFALRRKSA
jgi:hypothetical protein